MAHVVLYDQIARTDPRLGRNIEHDSRSRMFAYPATEEPLVSARHTSVIPTLDQGETGSCTGMSSTKNLSYPGFWEIFETTWPGTLSATDADLDQKVAEGVYSDAEVLDGSGPYPPVDAGSTGLSVAKVLTERGWISGYQHAFSLSACLTALTRQAVLVGTNFYTGMMEPDSTGRLRLTGQVEGGHEYVLDQIDTDAALVGMQNSWGLDWGKEGRGWISWRDLERLLGEQGDCTILTPLSAPAPVPDPDPVLPEPMPVPLAEQVWVRQAQQWIAMKHSSKANVDFERQTQAYLDWLASQR